jgi:hypothetical protein
MKPGLAPAKGLTLAEVKYLQNRQATIENVEILDNMA